MDKDNNVVDKQEVLKISNKAKRKTLFLGLWFPNIAHTFQRMYGLNFAGMLLPILKELYKKPADLAEAIQRHMGFYISEPTTGMAITGIIASMEEKHANGDEEISGESMEAVKTGLMGALAGFGDTLFTGTLRPLALSIFVPMGLSGNIMGPIGFLLFKCTARFANGIFWFYRGYKMGTNALTELLMGGKSKLKRYMEAASVLSMFVMGAMTCKYVTITTKLEYVSGEETIASLQNFLDDALPGILPLGATLLIYFLLKKKINPVKIIIGVMIVGILGAVGGIF